MIDYIDIRTWIENIHHEAVCLGEDFYIFDVSCRPSFTIPFKISNYGCCICLQGKARGIIDLMPTELGTGQIALNVPGQLLEQHVMSADFRGIGIILSRQFVESLGLLYNQNIVTMVRDCPVFKLNKPQIESALSYCNMAKRLLGKVRPFRHEMLRHLTCAFLYGIGSQLSLLSESRYRSNEEHLMYRFLNDIRTYYKRERKVSFYAEMLHLSPNYFSAVIKSFSGKSPVEWIDSYITSEACALLKGTNLTIQQISHELGFPSQSFFGKFFKRQMGLSPKEYRES